MSWQQLTDEEQRLHEEEVSEADWNDYANYLDTHRIVWWWLKQETNWIKRQEEQTW